MNYNANLAFEVTVGAPVIAAAKVAYANLDDLSGLLLGANPALVIGANNPPAYQIINKVADPTGANVNRYAVIPLGLSQLILMDATVANQNPALAGNVFCTPYGGVSTATAGNVAMSAVFSRVPEGNGIKVSESGYVFACITRKG